MVPIIFMVYNLRKIDDMLHSELAHRKDQYGRDANRMASYLLDSNELEYSFVSSKYGQKGRKMDHNIKKCSQTLRAFPAYFEVKKLCLPRKKRFEFILIEFSS